MKDLFCLIFKENDEQFHAKCVNYRFEAVGTSADHALRMFIAFVQSEIQISNHLGREPFEGAPHNDNGDLVTSWNNNYQDDYCTTTEVNGAANVYSMDLNEKYENVVKFKPNQE